MPTVIDTLSIELGLDVTKLQQGLKTMTEEVGKHSDESQKQFKVLDALIGSMGRSVAKLVTAFLSLEAAISAFAATRGISETGAQFANLADSIGMSVKQLSAWEQAMERVGGRKEDIDQAFSYQQTQLQRVKTTGEKGAPEFLGLMQRLGLSTDWNTYWDASRGAFDIDKLNKDIADAMDRARGPTGQPLSASERNAYLQGFGYSSAAAQRLFSSGGELRRRLEETSGVNVTDKQAEAFRRINALWVELEQTLENVGRVFTEKFEGPISAALNRMILLFKDMAGIIEQAQSVSKLYEGGPMRWLYDWWNRPSTPRTVAPAQVPPTVTHMGGQTEPSAASTSTGTWLRDAWRRVFGSDPYATTGQGPSPNSLMRTAPGAPSVVPYTPPGASVPSVGGGAAASPAPSSGAAPGASAPAGPPASFSDRFGFPEQHSSIDIGQLPTLARNLSASPVEGTNTSNNSVTIGGMTFNSRTSDTDLSFAPSGLTRELSVAQVASHYDTSIE